MTDTVHHVTDHTRPGDGQPRHEHGGVRGWFRHVAHNTSSAVGSPAAFALAMIIVLAWALTGPVFGYSDTWQLVINTGTTIITFLMVFLIQNTQNRDARAMHLKLDELIRGVRGARTRLVDLEDFSDDELDQLQREFERIRKKTADRPAHHPPAEEVDDESTEAHIRRTHPSP